MSDTFKSSHGGTKTIKIDQDLTKLQPYIDFLRTTTNKHV